MLLYRTVDDLLDLDNAFRTRFKGEFIINELFYKLVIRSLSSERLLEQGYYVNKEYTKAKAVRYLSKSY